MPNLSLLFAFVLLFGLFYLTATEYKALGKHVYASGLFIQNFRLLKDVGYFTTDALHQPLLHLWSLAIEEQFYIVFPIICAVLFKKWRSVKLLSLVTVTIVISSLVFCFTSGQGRDFNFYFPLTRFWEIGFGITLAMAEKLYGFKPTQIPLNIRHGLSVVGFGMIAIPMMMADSSTVHPGGFTLLPVLGAVALIAAYPDALINRYLLCFRPMTFVGLISYSLYLWHWPFLAFLFICYPAASDVWKIAILVLSVVVSALIYVGVENPVRRCVKIGKVKTEVVCLSMLTLAVLAGVLVSRFNGLPDRTFGYVAQEQLLKNKGDWNFYNKSPTIVYGDWKIRTGTPQQFPSIVFAGDSHAEQYFLRAHKLGKSTKKSVGFVTSSSCLILSPVTGMRKENFCRRASNSFYELIKDERVKVVVISQYWSIYSKDSLVDGLTKFYDEMKKRKDIKVFVLLDNPSSSQKAAPYANFNPIYHINRIEVQKSNLLLQLPNNRKWLEQNRKVEELSRGFATVIENKDYICPDGLCNLATWYFDSNHLNPKEVEKSAIWIDSIFQIKLQE